MLTRTNNAGNGVGIGDRERLLGWLMLAPAIVYIVILVAVPFGIAIALGMSSATVGNPTIHGFVGLDNFLAILQNPIFPVSLRNSLIVTFGTLGLVLVFSTIEAELLVQNFRGKWLVQILIILPWAMPVSLAAVDWLWLLDSQFSPIDWLLRAIGLLGPHTLLGPAKHLYYLGDPALGLASVIAINVWRLLPIATLIVLAGRTSIPTEVFEQAKIDGAGTLRTLFFITIPALMPILVVASLFTILLVFGEMGIVALTTHGGPGNSTQILPYWSFIKGINGGSLAQGAAIALFMFPILLVVAILALRTAARTGIEG